MQLITTITKKGGKIESQQQQIPDKQKGLSPRTKPQISWSFSRKTFRRSLAFMLNDIYIYFIINQNIIKRVKRLIYTESIQEKPPMLNY
jgi:hypothetical protein